MFLIIKSEGQAAVYNLTQVAALMQQENENDLNTYSICVTTADGSNDTIWASNEKLQWQTAFASILGALQDGEKTHTLENPAGYSLAALKAQALDTYDGTNYIGTIKYIRSVTGWGLVDAKKWADLHIKGSPEGRNKSKAAQDRAVMRSFGAAQNQL